MTVRGKFGGARAGVRLSMADPYFQPLFFYPRRRVEPRQSAWRYQLIWRDQLLRRPFAMQSASARPKWTLRWLQAARQSRQPSPTTTGTARRTTGWSAGSRDNACPSAVNQAARDARSGRASRRRTAGTSMLPRRVILPRSETPPRTIHSQTSPRLPSKLLPLPQPQLPHLQIVSACAVFAADVSPLASSTPSRTRSMSCRIRWRKASSKQMPSRQREQRLYLRQRASNLHQHQRQHQHERQGPNLHPHRRGAATAAAS